MTEHGGIRLSIVIAAALGVGFAASVFLNYTQHQHAEQDRQLLQGEIVDLHAQLKQDQQATANPSPSSSPSADASPSPSASPSSTPTVAGATSVSVSMYNVKLTATDPITDLAYGQVKSGTVTAAGFTTESLLAKYPACKPGPSALGILVRRPKGQTPPSQDKFVKTLGNYTFYYVKPTGTCATDQAGKDALAAARVSLANSVLPTISN